MLYFLCVLYQVQVFEFLYVLLIDITVHRCDLCVLTVNTGISKQVPI